jgi:hypothetical protein
VKNPAVAPVEVFVVVRIFNLPPEELLEDFFKVEPAKTT